MSRELGEIATGGKESSYVLIVEVISEILRPGTKGPEDDIKLMAALGHPDMDDKTKADY